MRSLPHQEEVAPLQIAVEREMEEGARERYDNLTIILPTLNEERSLPPLLSRLGALYPGANVIVADDDSSDGTRDAAIQYHGPLRVRVVHRKDSATRGLTASVVDAIREVETPVFVVMDADLQHPPEAVHELFTAASNGSHIAVGRRVNYRHLTATRRAISLSARALTRTYLRSKRRPTVDDPMSGFFGAKTSFARRVLRDHEPEFEGRGFKVLVDFLRFAPRGTHVHEVAYEFGKRLGGDSKLSRKHVIVLLRQLGFAGRVASFFLSSILSPVFWRFGAVGLSGVVVNELALHGLYGVAGLPLVLSSFAAIALAVVWNFAWNDSWTFSGRTRIGSWPQRLARFASHCAIGAVLNVAVLTALVAVGGVHYAVANAIGIGTATTWNWVLAHAWTWGEPQAA